MDAAEHARAEIEEVMGRETDDPADPSDGGSRA